MDEKDKRLHTRVKDPTVVVKIASIDKFRSFYLLDLSQGGLFIRCERQLPLNSEVDIKLIAPGLTEPLLLHGRIVRHETDENARTAGRVGMAIKFESLMPESADRLAKLVADHMHPKVEAPPAPAREEVAELIRELKNAREALSQREKDLEEQMTRLVQVDGQRAELARQCDKLRADHEALRSETAASRASGTQTEGRLEQQKNELLAELEKARSESMELRAQVAELEGHLQAYKVEFKTIENDEASTRALAERLAKEKAAIDRRRKDESGVATTEIQRLTSQVEAARADARDENKKGQELERRLGDAKKDGAALQAALDEAKAEGSALQAKLGSVQGELASAQAEVVRLREDLGRAHEANKEVTELKVGIAAERAKAASLERQLSDQKDQLERVRHKERELRRLMSLVSSQEDVVIVDDDTGEGEPAPAESPSPEPSGTNKAEAAKPAAAAPAQPPPPEAKKEEAAPEKKDAAPDGLAGSIEAAVSDLDIAIEDDASTGGKRLTAEDFKRLLKGGSAIVHTAELDSFSPGDDGETRLVAWLAAVDHFPALLGLARGSMNEDQLIDLCFQFYEKELIDLERPLG